MDPMMFANMPLDRASNLRKNSDWLAKQRSNQHGRYVLYWRGHYVFTGNGLFCLSVDELTAFQAKNNNVLAIFLGLEQGKPWFVIDASSMDDKLLLEHFPITLHTIEFRRSIHQLTQEHAAILGFAKALCHWHSQSQHCGRCGQLTEPDDGGHVLRCIADNCGHDHFPRTDPAVIMLVQHQPEDGPALCLLAQHARIPSNVYSTLAGFVDPGESLEEAVIREVMEEAGVAVTNVTYVASQPWPFPGSIMLGFTATAKNTALNIDYDEISGAKWFTANEIRQFGNWGDDGDGNQLPRKESIARQLINAWLASQP